MLNENEVYRAIVDDSDDVVQATIINDNHSSIGQVTNNHPSSSTVIPTKKYISYFLDDTDIHPIKQANTLTGLISTITELNFVDGVTSSIQEQLDSKVDKVSGKGLSTNDFTNAFKTKLEGIEAGAEVNKVNSVNGQVGNVTINIPTKTSDLTNDSNFATVSQIPTNNNQLVNGAGYITGITSSDVTTALGYTPYNSTNPNGYITSSALNGYATEQYVDDIVGNIETILASI